MRVVNETIEDGVGVGRIADDLMPGRNGKLGGEDRRSAPVALFEDFREAVVGAGVERLGAEVVEAQEIGAAEGFQKARMSTTTGTPASA